MIHQILHILQLEYSRTYDHSTSVLLLLGIRRAGSRSGRPPTWNILRCKILVKYSYYGVVASLSSINICCLAYFRHTSGAAYTFICYHVLVPTCWTCALGSSVTYYSRAWARGNKCLKKKPKSKHHNNNKTNSSAFLFCCNAGFFDYEIKFEILYFLHVFFLLNIWYYN